MNTCIESSLLTYYFYPGQGTNKKNSNPGTIAATIVAFHHQEAFTPQGLWNLRKRPWHPDESFCSFSFVAVYVYYCNIQIITSL